MKNDTNNQPGSVGMGLRFCSALLAALSFCTSFGSVAVMAEETAPAAETVQPLTEEPAQAVKRKHNAVCPNRAIIAVVL